MSKKAILTVSFGTTFPETCEKTIGATETQIQQAFPEADIFRAFTSTVVISRIQKREGVHIATPAEAMKQLAERGYEDVTVASLHLIPGIEYDRLVTAVSAYEGQFKSLTISQPLLTVADDFRQAVQFIRARYQLAPNQGALFMGHGTAANAFTTYACLDHMLMGSGYYLGAVESYPDVQFEINRMKQDGIRKVILQPFMMVAGNHAHNDMASDDPKSWRSQVERAGIEAAPKLIGLGEYPEIREKFVKKVSEAQWLIPET